MVNPLLASDNYRILTLINNQTMDGIGLRWGTNRTLKLFKINDGVITDLESFSNITIPVTTHIKLDIEICRYGEDCLVNIYYNGSLQETWTGDASTRSSELNQLFFGPSAINTNTQKYFSELIVADSDTRLLRLKTLAMNADGDTNDWTGSYTDINSVANGTTYLATSDVNKLFTASLTGMPVGKWAIAAVKVSANLLPTPVGKGISLGIKTNNVVHLSDPFDIIYRANKEITFQKNPETDLPFTVDDIDALQIALKSETIS
jgi:hypothetical protein